MGESFVRRWMIRGPSTFEAEFDTRTRTFSTEMDALRARTMVERYRKREDLRVAEGMEDEHGRFHEGL